MRKQPAQLLESLTKQRLIGNSGCKLSIIKDKVYKVRKQSSNLSNSERLNKQLLKIKSFKKYKKILAPDIFNFGKKKKLFFYDMKYINGITLRLTLVSKPFIETKNYTNNILEYILFCKKNSTYLYKKKNFLFKISELKSKIKLKKPFLSKIFNKIQNYNWSNINHSNSNWYLSLENIIIKKNEIYFIDLSENFITSKAVAKKSTKYKNNLFKLEDIENINILVKKAEGKKCPRCWKIFPGPCVRCGTNK